MFRNYQNIILSHVVQVTAYTLGKFRYTNEGNYKFPIPLLATKSVFSLILSQQLAKHEFPERPLECHFSEAACVPCALS